MSPNGRITVRWHGTGRRPQVAPNPAYPRGVVVGAAPGATACEVALKYPSESVGQWEIRCRTCGQSLIVTAASRPDDPHTVRVPCKGPQGDFDQHSGFGAGKSRSLM